MFVIGLTGLAGAGKSTVASMLIQEYGFQRAKFAGALKEMLATLLRYRGVDEMVIARMIDGDLKEVPTGHLNGKSPRQAMQTLGTEWGRQHVDVNLWVDTESDFIRSRAAKTGGGLFVFDDVRFANEVEAIRDLGGEVWSVEMEGGPMRSAPAHASESLVLKSPDAVIRNQLGNMGLLRRQIDDAMIRVGKAAAADLKVAA